VAQVERALRSPRGRALTCRARARDVTPLIDAIPEFYRSSGSATTYQQIASLLHVVLVSHDEKRIDVWSRGDEGWNVVSARPGESVVLERIGCRLDVDDVYRDPLTA
jgi:hypothetical protein